MTQPVAVNELARYLADKINVANMRQILERMTDGVLAIDKNAVIFYTNPAYSKVSGIPWQALLGRNMREIEPQAAILGVLESGLQKNIRLSKANACWQLSIWPLYEQGELSGAFSFFRNISPPAPMRHEERTGASPGEGLPDKLMTNNFAAVAPPSDNVPDWHQAIRELEKKCLRKACKPAGATAAWPFANWV